VRVVCGGVSAQGGAVVCVGVHGWRAAHSAHAHRCHMHARAPSHTQPRAATHLPVSTQRRHCMRMKGSGRCTVMGSGFGLNPTYTACCLLSRTMNAM
jgi:hypothetical protein